MAHLASPSHPVPRGGARSEPTAEHLRNELAVYIKNTQRICAKDVEKLCTHGRYASAQARAYTDWSGQYRRHMHDAWDDVPLGFGAAADECLRDELTRYRAGAARRVIPKCVDWMEKTGGQFAALGARERGNDRRERFVIFATVFAVAAAGVVGYMFGIFLKERDDLFAYQDRDENTRVLRIVGAAIVVPAGVVLWASPKLLLVMAGTFGMGRGAQHYVQRRKEVYAAVPREDTGVVFAAIPVPLA